MRDSYYKYETHVDISLIWLKEKLKFYNKKKYIKFKY